MIDLSYDYNAPKNNVCECGDDECIGPAHIAAVVAESLPVLQAPLLKLVKERNEARRMCELLAAAMPDLAFAVTSQKAMDAANNEMHQALMAYVKTRKHWDERSWK
jgi:CO dehydrogenase/acetyl-CoA synthase gamma subunit (corrinoid Fe-S protein)